MKITSIILLALLLTACSPRLVEQVRTEYKAVTDHQRDTLWRDRERTVYIKGDTVREKVTEYVYKTRWKTQTDTLFVHDTTRITAPPKIVREEQPLTWWKKLRLRAFWILLAAVVFAYRRQLLRILRAFISF